MGAKHVCVPKKAGWVLAAGDGTRVPCGKETKREANGRSHDERQGEVARNAEHKA